MKNCRLLTLIALLAAPFLCSATGLVNGDFSSSTLSTKSDQFADAESDVNSGWWESNIRLTSWDITGGQLVRSFALRGNSGDAVGTIFDDVLTAGNYNLQFDYNWVTADLSGNLMVQLFLYDSATGAGDLASTDRIILSTNMPTDTANWVKPMLASVDLAAATGNHLATNLNFTLSSAMGTKDRLAVRIYAVNFGTANTGATLTFDNFSIVSAVPATNPALSYVSTLTAGTQGDGKGQPGETINAYIKLNNSGTPATNVQASITSTNAGFIIGGSPASFGTITSSASNSIPVTITIPGSAPLGTYTFNVTNITTDSGGTAVGGSFTIQVIGNDILWRVDMDGAALSTESGFLRWTNSAITRTQTFANVGDGPAVNLTAAINPGPGSVGAFSLQQRNTQTSVSTNLYRDALQFNDITDGSITLELSGLTEGDDYQVTLWAFDSQYGRSTTQSYYNVTGGSNVFLGALTNTPSTGGELPSGSPYLPTSLYDSRYAITSTLTAGAGGMLSINMSTVTNNQRINGFEVVRIIATATNPILSFVSALVTNQSGDAVMPGDTLYAYFSTANSGTDAQGVSVAVSGNSAEFTVSGSPAVVGDLAKGVTSSNSAPVIITAKTNAAPGDYVFTVTPASTNGYYQSTGGSFPVQVFQAVSAAPGSFALTADVNGTTTNSSLSVSNSAAIPLYASFTDDAGWLSVSPASITIAPHSASNISLIAGPIASQTQLFGTVSATYSLPATNFTSFPVQFDVGAKIDPSGVVITNIGGVNLFPSDYEPGEILSITVTSTNNGAITVNNITNRLVLPSGWSATPASTIYPTMIVGSSTTTTYQVTIPFGTANGTYTGTVENAANGSSWRTPFTISVFYQPIPAASTNLILSVVQGRTNSASITLTNAGNANTTFSFSGGLSWVTNIPSSGTVTAQSSRTVSFVANATGQSIGTNSTTSYISWGNGDTSAVDVTVIVVPPPSVQYLSATTASGLIPGNTVDVYLTLTNSGTDASGVTAYVTPANSNFTVTANGAPASFGNINAGAIASNALPVKIKININTLPGTYTFNVTNIAAANGGTASSGSFTLTIQPMVQYVTNTLSKSPMLAGQAVNAYITLTNAGSVQARLVTANITTTNAGFTIQSGSPASFGTFAAGTTVSNSSPVVIRADGTVLPGTYTFNVTNMVTADGYVGGTGSFTVTIQAPVQYVGTTLSTNAILPGGSINAYITLTNSSGTAASAVFATVSTTNAGFTVSSGSPASFGTIAAGKTASNSVPVVIRTDITVPAGTYTFDVTDIGTTSAKGYNTSFSVSVTNTVFNLTVVVSGGSRILSWTKPVDGLSRLYTVYYTTNLVSGAWNVLAEIPNGYSYIDNDPPVPSRSYRVTVE